MKTSPQFVALVLSLALITASTPAIGQSYSVDNLGTLGGTASRASGINNAGLIVGTAETAAGDDRAFQFINAQISDLGIKGSRSVATSVNATGGIAGYYFDGNYNAFVFINGKQHDLGNLGLKYSVAYAINAMGHAAGSSLAKGGLYGHEHAFLWTGGKMTDLGTLGGDSSSARGLNKAEEVVGYSYLANGAPRAFLRTSGKMIDLGTLGGDYSIAYAINDAGQVVGQAARADTQAHAFLWAGSGPLQDLGDLGDNVSEAFALNSTGAVVVGRATVPSNTGYIVYHAFVWSGGVMRDLNDLISPNSGWVLQEATAVDDVGVIVGAGLYGSEVRAFRLTPR